MPLLLIRRRIRRRSMGRGGLEGRRNGGENERTNSTFNFLRFQPLLPRRRRRRRLQNRLRDAILPRVSGTVIKRDSWLRKPAVFFAIKLQLLPYTRGHIYPSNSCSYHTYIGGCERRVALLSIYSGFKLGKYFSLRDGLFRPT